MPKSVIVFDAYGTLFDVAGAARQAAVSAPRLAEVWPRLAEDWRRKQLEYSWLRAIMGAHADFAEVTADALDWALEAAGLGAAAGPLRPLLLDLYRRLPAYPEAAGVLAQLRAQGKRLAILSNGAPPMLAEAVASAGLEGLFEAVISVEEVGVYKPDARTYALIPARLGANPRDVLFVSSNGWDVAGAARFGFTAVWVNRAGLPMDRLPHGPAHVVRDLTQLGGL
ncbi:haloacid dehalogenase type II [Rhodobacter sp. Har01]|uniref:haloacid dehalogenase type II n=1 Tax=Rhodobacter sp. Har01 TaxID=2883999 RepID=UPI001D060B14|nr:haloacid dehalogenase type II [Rhodobacter sp. Har01]MCB6178223.1 haloacid dehalogenase type II [Rhodobacter sp. Har01]